jgi:histidinol-phosphate aminotransferase
MPGSSLDGGQELQATSIRQQRGLDLIQPYVPGKAIAEVQREYGLGEVVKLASNENPLGPSPKAVAALQAALTEINYYPDAQSYELCQALASRLGVAPEQVIVGNGADGLIRCICAAYLQDEDEVIVSRSSFPIYESSAYIMRATVIKTPLLPEYRIDLAAMADAITPRTKLIFVCNPNNPTGTIVSDAEVAAFMERVPDHVLVVFDEAYHDFVEDGRYRDSVHYVREGRKNVMALRTFSKIYGLAGVRLGYGVAAAEVLAPLYASKEPFVVNLLAQVAGLAALEDDQFVQRTLEMIRVGRRFLYQQFEQLGLRYVPTQTNFILVEIGPQATEVYRKLLAKGVIVRPCNGYDLPECLRITIGTPEQNERLISALREVLA